VAGVVPGAGAGVVVVGAVGAGDDAAGAGVEVLARIGCGVGVATEVVAAGAGEPTAGAPVG
jgi:hypothetical protein